jgi:hypothetical protein
MYQKPEFERRVKIEAVKVLGNSLILNSCDSIILFEEDKSIKKIRSKTHFGGGRTKKQTTLSHFILATGYCASQ